MNYQLLYFSEVNLENITYLEPVIEKNNYFIPIRHGPKSAFLFVELPKLQLNESCKKNHLLIELKSTRDDITNKVRNFFNTLDTKAAIDIKKHAKSWCSNIKLKNVIYKSLVTQIDDDNKTDEQELINLFIGEVNKQSRMNYTKVYDRHKIIIDPSEYNTKITKKNWVQTIVELRGINIDVNDDGSINAFYVIRTHQARVTLNLQDVVLESYSFMHSEDYQSDGEQENESSESDEQEEIILGNSSDLDKDGDDESEDEGENEDDDDEDDEDDENDSETQELYRLLGK